MAFGSVSYSRGARSQSRRYRDHRTNVGSKTYESHQGPVAEVNNFSVKFTRSRTSVASPDQSWYASDATVQSCLHLVGWITVEFQTIDQKKKKDTHDDIQVFPPPSHIYSWTTSTPPWLATSTWPRHSGTVCSLQLQTRRPILMLMTHLCALIVQPSYTQTEVNHNCNYSP